ncbi:MAG: ATPase, partial [Candidatus Bathyarchaeota archaeon]|nr:ATPase [Candidatus Bathyarchaeota archaeon]
MPSKISHKELEELIYEDVKITRANAPRFILNSEEIDIWSEPYNRYHSKSSVEYLTEKILECEKKGLDPFPSIVGKKKEKEIVKSALLSNSPILFKGKKGYGKTTFSKAIAELLPPKLLAVKGCKIYDDPANPSCFSCKRKLLEDNVVELTWIPRIWVRIPGDPMLTTRQLVGGVSIQKIR